MITFKRGSHLIIKDEDVEVVITDHFKNRFKDRSNKVDIKKLLKILKVAVNIYSNYGAGSYDVINDKNEAVKISIYKDNKHNINKIDLISFIDNNNYNFKNDTKIFTSF